MRKYLLGFAAGISLVASCSGLVVDPSISAVEAGDYTLALSACENTPAGGMDVCHVTEGTKIQSSWKLFIPTKKDDKVLGWEADFIYRDAQHQVHLTGEDNIAEIKWSEFFGETTWTKDMDGEALALVTVRYKANDGTIQIVQFRGIAKLVVTKPGYSRLPIDSGFITWGTTCKVSYTSAGRSSVSCK